MKTFVLLCLCLAVYAQTQDEVNTQEDPSIEKRMFPLMGANQVKVSNTYMNPMGYGHPLQPPFGTPFGMGTPVGMGSPFGMGRPFGMGPPLGIGAPFGYGPGFGGMPPHYGGLGYGTVVPGAPGFGFPGHSPNFLSNLPKEEGK